MLYIVFNASFFSLHCTYDILFDFTFYTDLFKILHVFILLKEKLMPSPILHFMGHVNFLLIEQVSAHPLHVYFLDLDRSAGSSPA